MTYWPNEDMRKHVQALCYGFSEHIEWTVEVNGQHERRGSVRRFEGLIHQLEANATTPLQASGQNGPGSPNKAGSRPPLNQAYADLLDTIHEGAIDAWNILEGENEPPPSLYALLAALSDSVARQCLESPRDCERVSRMAAEWVRRARVQLGYETRTVRLQDARCGHCDGYLVVAADASTDVRCIGTENTPSCGQFYGRLQWLKLALES